MIKTSDTITAHSGYVVYTHRQVAYYVVVTVDVIVVDAVIAVVLLLLSMLLSS